jgi:hypothetical protein
MVIFPAGSIIAYFDGFNGDIAMINVTTSSFGAMLSDPMST